MWRGDDDGGPRSSSGSDVGTVWRSQSPARSLGTCHGSHQACGDTNEGFGVPLPEHVVSIVAACMSGDREIDERWLIEMGGELQAWQARLDALSVELASYMWGVFAGR